MAVSYHVHSCWSDGERKIPEIVSAARNIGLDELGLSDHYCLTADRRQMDWCMPLDGMDDYVADVQSAAGDAGEDLLVRLGMEVDFIPETAKEMGDLLATQPFDYVIGSVHIVDGFLIDETLEGWEPLTEDERNEVIRTYWIRIRQMAESRLFDFAGHLDLTKKFAIYPTIDLSAEISSALDAVAASEMAVEINTAGWFKECCEAYPSPAIVRGCFERGIPMVVSADAHVPENLTRAFDRAYRLLRDTGYTELTSYAGRMKYPYPLPEATPTK